MNDKKARIQAELDAAYAELLALIDSLRSQDLVTPTHNGYVDVHATLAHLASAEPGRLLLTRVCYLLTPLPLPMFFINIFNALQVGRHRRASLDDFKRELAYGHAVTQRYLERLSDTALARLVRDPVYGRIPLEQVFILGHAAHQRGHLDEIKKVLDT
jgi:hypothetical protein